jgi:hypothetical protein
VVWTGRGTGRFPIATITGSEIITDEWSLEDANAWARIDEPAPAQTDALREAARDAMSCISLHRDHLPAIWQDIHGNLAAALAQPAPEPASEAASGDLDARYVTHKQLTDAMCRIHEQMARNFEAFTPEPALTFRDRAALAATDAEIATVMADYMECGLPWPTRAEARWVFADALVAAREGGK